MARKMKRFADGGKADARYERKVADIKSDYDKWIKSGKYGNADVAKAKMEQRMADAKDDLAKWTGADRTTSRAGEKAAEEALSIARKTKGANIANRDRPSTMLDRPEFKLPEVDVPKVAPRLKVPAKRTAPVRRAAAPTKKVEAAPAAEKEITVTAAKPRQTEAQGAQRRDYATRIQDLEQKIARARVQGTRPLDQDIVGLRRMKEEKAKLDRLGGELSPAERAAEYRRRLTRTAGMGSKAGGSIKKYAKGGSIDGCAVRGKTKAMRKK